MEIDIGGPNDSDFECNKNKSCIHILGETKDLGITACIDCRVHIRIKA